MSFGSMSNDDGNLLLSSEEKEKLLNKYPNAEVLIKKFSGSQEFIRGLEKFFLWIIMVKFFWKVSKPHF